MAQNGVFLPFWAIFGWSEGETSPLKFDVDVEFDVDSDVKGAGDQVRLPYNDVLALKRRTAGGTYPYK